MSPVNYRMKNPYQVNHRRSRSIHVRHPKSNDVNEHEHEHEHVHEADTSPVSSDTSSGDGS